MKIERQSGLHLIGTLINCDFKIMTDYNKVFKILKSLPKLIEMVVIEHKNNPFLYRTKEEYGFTGISTLYESHFFFTRLARIRVNRF